MNREEREKMVKLLNEKVLECAAKHQHLREKQTIQHTEELTNLKIAENEEMNEIKKNFAVPAPVSHKIFRGDISSLKEAVKGKWTVTSFKKDVSETVEIADRTGCINPDLIRKPFCFEYVSLEE